jgi:hypothetical protein
MGIKTKKLVSSSNIGHKRAPHSSDFLKKSMHKLTVIIFCSLAVLGGSTR